MPGITVEMAAGFSANFNAAMATLFSSEAMTRGSFHTANGPHGASIEHDATMTPTFCSAANGNNSAAGS